MPVPPALVWYVAYGSNLCRDRFDCYVRGGTPAGGARCYGGCRDAAPARATRTLTLPGAVRFAGRSLVWGGGIAFYDPERPGPAPAVGYLVTAGQFSDIVAQENGREAEDDLDPSLLSAAAECTLAEGRYARILRVGYAEGAPMLTITAPVGARPPLAAPSAAYLAVIGDGLAEAHGWGRARVEAHLTELRCAAD